MNVMSKLIADEMCVGHDVVWSNKESAAVRSLVDEIVA